MKDLTKGKPSVLILSFALPVFLANLLQLTYSIVDTRIVGTFLGENMLAAVGSTTTLSNLIIGFLLGLSNGFAIVTAQKFGAKDIKAVKKSFAAALILGVSIALIITAAGLIFLWPILKFLNIPQDLSGEASAYISVIIAGLLATFLYDMCAPVLRAIGDTITPLIILAVSVMLNVAGDIFFVVILKEGVRGAAIATVLGNICGDIFYVIFIIKKCRYLSVDFRKLKVTGAEVLAVLAIGIPASVTNFMQSIGVTLTNRFLQPHGTDKVAAMGIALKIIMISVLVMVGFAFGGQPLVGYNYGAKNKKRFNETIRFAFLLEVLTGAGMAIVLGAAAPLLVGLFLKDASVIAVAQQILRVQLIGMPFVGIVLASTCIFQAIGNGAGALILSAGRQGVIFAIVIICTSKIAGFSGVIASQPVSDFLTALVAVMILLQWKKKALAD